MHTPGYNLHVALHHATHHDLLQQCLSHERPGTCDLPNKNCVIRQESTQGSKSDCVFSLLDSMLTRHATLLSLTAATSRLRQVKRLRAKIAR